MLLTEIAPPRFDVDLDLRYATADNLTGTPIYHHARCLLHPDAAAALTRAVVLARGLGCRLRLFDGFRPAEAQWRLWNALPDPHFIADPRSGSSHSRGVAIDLTLADADRRPLDMGTGFDEMTPQSHHGRTDLPAMVQRNRACLLGVMVAAGWRSYPYEWWHYQLPEAERYPPLADSVTGGAMLSR
jgi:D-alanyl-D-alanine dipeptidase